jgi:hypothetical protein
MILQILNHSIQGLHILLLIIFLLKNITKLIILMFTQIIQNANPLSIY